MLFGSNRPEIAVVRRAYFICAFLLTVLLAGWGCSKPNEPVPDTDPGPLPGRETDTLQILDGTISPGDTTDVIIYIVNTEQLGGYTFRFSFDTSLFEVVTETAGSAVLDAEQLRGDFSIFNIQTPEPGIAAGVLAFSQPNGLLPGGGNTIRLRLSAKPYAPPAKKSFFEFVDAPYDTNVSNWFAAFSGAYQYRPVRIPGEIKIVAKQ